MIIRGAFVHTPELGQLEILQDHLIEVNEDGIITHFSAATSRKSQSLIEEYGRSEDDNRAPYIVLPQGTLLLPTFCDLHLHAPQFLYQGTGLDRPLMQWLDKYALKAEARLDGNPHLAKRVYDRLARRLKENGTGTVVLFGTIKKETNIILAQSMLHAGIRAFIGKVSMDIDITPEDSPTHGTYIEPSTSAALENAKHFLDDLDEVLQLKQFSGDAAHLWRERRYAKSLIRPILTPRFVPTCTDELLKGLGGLAYERDVWIQTHVHEARDEVEWVKQERGVEGLEVLRRNNLLTSRTILAHCTYLPSDEELAAHRTQPLAEAGSSTTGSAITSTTSIHQTSPTSTSLPPTPYTSHPPQDSLSLLASCLTTLAHCPLSNFYFSAGRAFPLREALSTGCRVGYGSDIAGGYSADIMNAMRTGVLTGRGREGGRKEAERKHDSKELEEEKSLDTNCQRTGYEDRSLAIDWKESLYVATRGGAIALGLKGMFAVGGSFDAQEIKIFDSVAKQGVGALDFFDAEEELRPQDLDLVNMHQVSNFALNDDAIEKWWCVGDLRNRGRMWVLGRGV